ncbi:MULTISPECIES: PRC-barrel domain-containing protein, partial [Streptomyces]
TLSTTGLSGLPNAKTFLLPHGGTVSAPRIEVEGPLANATAARFPGGPIEPTGNPLLSGVGPGAWTERPDVADLEYFSGLPRIVPLRAAPGYTVAAEDPDPRGMAVVGADGASGGRVVELWIDKSETMIRYLEVATNGGRTVLVPAPLADVQGENGKVYVHTILGG